MVNGNLPDGWELKTVGDIVTFEYGKGLTQSKRDPNGKVPVYGSNGIVGYHSSALIDKPCLIVGRKGAAGAVHKSEIPCWPIDTTYYVIPPDNVNLSFLYYLFSSLDFPSLDRSTAIPGLNRNDAYAVEIPLPPLPEQEWIVSRIEELFSDLEAGVAALGRVRVGLRRYKASVLKAACEGRLTPSGHSDAVPVRGELPEGWRWVTIDELTKHLTSGSRGWAKYYSDSGSLFVRVGNFNRLSKTIDLEKIIFVNEPEGAEANRTRLRARDLLITMTADVGMVGVVDENTLRWGNAYINQHVGLVRLNEPDFVDYVAYALASEIGQKQFREKQYGATKTGLNFEDIKSLEIPLPSLDEQRRIVAEVERRLSVVGEVESAVEAGLARSARLRQAVLRSAFEGRL
jgi:type I restriction enzyme S subunit